MSAQHPPGYEVPVFRSLYEPILLGGAPRTFAIGLWVCAFAGGARFGLRFLLVVMLAASVVHIAIAIGTKFDPDFTHVLSRSFRSPSQLDP